MQRPEAVVTWIDAEGYAHREVHADHWVGNQRHLQLVAEARKAEEAGKPWMGQPEIRVRIPETESKPAPPPKGRQRSRRPRREIA